MSFKVIQDAFGRGLTTERAIRSGEPVITLEGRWVDAPSKYTIQLGADKHLMPDDHLWALINHSCEPNLHVDPIRHRMVAARDIAAGEALSFNYLSTEWDMAEPFRCNCQSPNCHGVIAGARHQQRMNDVKHALVWQERVDGNLAGLPPLALAA